MSSSNHLQVLDIQDSQDIQDTQSIISKIHGSRSATFQDIISTTPSDIGNEDDFYHLSEYSIRNTLVMHQATGFDQYSTNSTQNHDNQAQPLAMIEYSRDSMSGVASQIIRQEEGNLDKAVYIDVTEYLILPQHQAALKMGVPSSTLRYDHIIHDPHVLSNISLL